MNTTTKTFFNSQKLFTKAKQLAPGGVHSPVRSFASVGGTPLFIKSAQGPVIFDVDGNDYIDFCMSWGPLILGHNDQDVSSAISQGIENGWTYGTAEPYSLELMEFIMKKIPWIEKIRFVNSGTEAVMSAIRLARAATRRDKIIKFSGCYHGHTDSMLVKAGSGLAELASPDSAGITSNLAKDTVVVALDDINAITEAFDIYEDQIAAVIVEPIQANYGLLIQQDNFLSTLREITTKNQSLLIFDEVITGFRTAFGGMAEISGVEPDIAVYGKIIGGGFPVGAYAGKSNIMDLIAPSGPVYQAGTLSANPVAMKAGLATLKKLCNQNPYKNLINLSDILKNEINQKVNPTLPDNLQIRIQTFGSLFWMALGIDIDPDQPIRTFEKIPDVHKSIFQKLYHRLIQRGYYLAPAAFEVGFLSTCHTEGHIKGLAGAIKEELLKTDN